MDRILIIPEELITSLKEAYSKEEVRSKWQKIDVDTESDMLNRVVNNLNERYDKLNIVSCRVESKEKIREMVGNKGNNSIYTGYYEDKNGNVDGLFFYIPPTLDSGNDILTRQVMPVLIGIYEGICDYMADLHFHNRPVFVVNLNETNRTEQPAVKSSIICAEIMGIQYLDIFQRSYYDILYDNEKQKYTKIDTIDGFDRMLTQNGNKSNEFFEINKEERRIKILSNRLKKSTNLTAELYRYCMRIIPAVYLSSKEKYLIDISELKNIHNERVDIVVKFISKYNCKN